MSNYHNDWSGSRSSWGRAQHGLPFLERLRRSFAPGVEAVVVRPNDLAERVLPAAVVPAGEADVVGVVELGDFDEVAGSAGEQGIRRSGKVEAVVVVETGG
jgi:hypothetical protein